MKTFIHNKHGIALIMVMGFLLLILTLFIFFVKSIEILHDASATLPHIVQARLNAEAGIHTAVRQIKQSFEKNPMPPISNRQTWFKKIKTKTFEVQVTDLASQINLNSVHDFKEFQQTIHSLNSNISIVRSKSISPILRLQWKQPIPVQRGFLLSLHEIGSFFLSSPNQIYFRFKPYLTHWNSHCYAHNNTPQFNLQALRTTPITLEQEKHFKSFYTKPEKAYQILSCLIDFMDQDNIPFTVKIDHKILTGHECGPLINEVCWQTKRLKKKGQPYHFSNSNGGEFIEIWNPYSQPVHLKNYQLHWNSQKNGHETHFFPDKKLQPNEFLLITDNTQRLKQTNTLPPNASIYEIDFFEISTPKVWIQNKSYIETFECQKKISQGKSLVKDDPRSNDPKNYYEGYSPGQQNSSFSQTLDRNDFTNKRKDFRRLDDLSLPSNSLSFLPYVYCGGTAWNYLKLSSKQIQDTNKNGIFEDEEAGDFRLLQYLCAYDETQPNSFLENSSVPHIWREHHSNRININTAPLTVLLHLPGWTPKIAKQVISHRKVLRKNKNCYQHIYDVLIPFKKALGSSAKVDRLFWNSVNHMTVRSHCFHILSKGSFQEISFAIDMDIEICFRSNQDNHLSDPFIKVLSQTIRRALKEKDVIFRS